MLEAFNWEEHFESEAALKQMTYGDIIILNKTDLATTAKLEELEAYIQEMKVSARIIHSTYGEVPLPLILGVGLTQKEEYTSFGEKNETHAHHHEHDKHEHHHHSNHLENDGFVSVSYQSDRPFDIHKFETFLAEEMPQEVFRAKGILWFSDSELRHIFQLSGPRYNLNADDWYTPPKNQVVFIGKKLDASQIHSQLNNCLV